MVTEFRVDRTRPGTPVCGPRQRVDGYDELEIGVGFWTPEDGKLPGGKGPNDSKGPSMVVNP